MIPALTYAPPLALPAPDAFRAANRVVPMNRFDGLIERAVSDAHACLVFRIPARPGSGYREIAALTARKGATPAVTLVTLGEDGATVSVAPDDPALALFTGLARSYADLMQHWAAA